MRTIAIVILTALTAGSAVAGERIAGTDFYHRQFEAYPTGEKTGYWILHNTGILNSSTGPLGTMPGKCHGGGFWDAGGSWGSGVCLRGEGDDTFAISWEEKKGEGGGTWEFVGGTGKWAGITGSGTYKGTLLSSDTSISEWEGEMNLPK